MAAIARTIKVSGRVQGVFFRASTKTKAEELNIKGFIRNEPDGSVYIEAEGDESSMAKFIDWCKQGPRSAKVDQCSVAASAAKGFEGFTVKR